jgi:hypothetical protein
MVLTAAQSGRHEAAPSEKVDAVQKQTMATGSESAAVVA